MKRRGTDRDTKSDAPVPEHSDERLSEDDTALRQWHGIGRLKHRVEQIEAKVSSSWESRTRSRLTYRLFQDAKGPVIRIGPGEPLFYAPEGTVAHLTPNAQDSWWDAYSAIANVALESLALGHDLGHFLQPDAFELPSPDHLDTIRDALQSLVMEYEDLDRRLVNCARLEQALGAFEKTLQEEGLKFFRWGTGLLRDVLSYNYSENLTLGAVEAIETAIDALRTRGAALTQGEYRSLRERLLGEGLTIVPTSERATEEYGHGDQP